MGIKEVGDNLLKAESLLRIADRKASDTASGEANAAMADLVGARNLLQRNKDISNEADQRTQRVLEKLKEVQRELDALSELFTEGAANGSKIQSYGQSAVAHAGVAVDKIDESKQIIESTNLPGLSDSFLASHNFNTEVRAGSEVIAEMGERHAAHYTATAQTHEELSDAVKQARAHLTPLREQIWEGPNATSPGRSTNIENVLEAVEWSALPAIARTATAISVSRQQLNM